MMASLNQALTGITTLTFDCYGTLIDWRAGLRDALGRLFGPSGHSRQDGLFDAYVATEAEVEAEPYRRYRQVMAETARRLAGRLGFALDPGRAEQFADMLPDWAPFPDTNEALATLKGRFRLGILSNVDRDLFAGTARRLSVEFDFLVVAEDVRAYKPSLAHFERCLAGHARRVEMLHVAQSLYHDGVPTGQLGLGFVWINRYGHPDDPRISRVGTFADLLGFARAAAGSSARVPGH